MSSEMPYLEVDKKAAGDSTSLFEGEEFAESN